MRTSARLMTVVCLLCIVGTACGAEPASELVHGRVIRSDGMPAGGAQVWVISGRTPESRAYQTGTVGADGWFSIPAPAANAVVVSAEGQGIALIRPLKMTNNIRLDKPTRLRLHVVDRQGQPIAAVPIALNIDPGISIISKAMPAELRDKSVQATDAQGYCTFEGLAQGTDIPFEVLDDRFAQPESKGLRLTQRETSEGEITLTPGVTIRGTIVFQDTGKPAAGVQISAQCRTSGTNRNPMIFAATDADGKFALTNLFGYRLSYELIFDLPEAIRSEYAVHSLYIQNLVDGEQIQPFTVQLVRGGVVRGKITGAPDSAPLGSVRLTAYETVTVPAPPMLRAGAPAFTSVSLQAASTTTAADGTYQLQLPEGQFTIYAIGSGQYSRAQVNATIDVGKTVESDMMLSRQAQVEGKITVHGRVHDPDGKPVGGVSITATPRAGAQQEYVTSSSKDDGEFSLSNVDPDSELSVRSRVWMLHEPVKIAGKSSPIDLTVRQDEFASLRAAVVDESGKPISGATVRLWVLVGSYRSSDGIGDKWTGDDGIYNFDWLEPNHEIEVRALAAGYVGTPTRVTLQPGKQAEVQLRLVKPAVPPAPGARRGTAGSPVPRAKPAR